MSDKTKYESLLEDLNSIETRLTIFKERAESVTERNEELKKLLNILKKENFERKEQIEILESKIEDSNKVVEDLSLKSLNLEEKENLKVKIKDLIERIDFRLSEQ